jgi:hypothetical protein
MLHPEIIQRDDGRFAIGLGDAPAFETRAFALQVASGDPPAPAPITKFRRVRFERCSGMHAPDKPNPTPGLEGRADRNMSFGRLSTKQDENYSDREDFASDETALAYALRVALARKAAS